MPQAYYDEAAVPAPAPAETPLTAGEPPAPEAAYSFEGYRIEFNEKVMLIPAPLTKTYG